MSPDGRADRGGADPAAGNDAGMDGGGSGGMACRAGLRCALRTRLAQALPGREAHRRAWPDYLPGSPRSGSVPGLVAAAVLIALHPDCDPRPEPAFDASSGGAQGASGSPVRMPLIQRPDDQARHPGQVAFPGGVVEEGESILEAALREAREEIGLDPLSVEPLGHLTPVDVHVTGFRIHPVVGWLESPPAEWRPKPDEVAGVYSADPDLLLHEGPGETLRRSREGIEMCVPAYSIRHGSGTAHVWGATAIILAEFLEIWAQAR